MKRCKAVQGSQVLEHRGVNDGCWGEPGSPVHHPVPHHPPLLCLGHLAHPLHHLWIARQGQGHHVLVARMLPLEPSLPCVEPVRLPCQHRLASPHLNHLGLEAAIFEHHEQISTTTMTMTMQHNHHLELDTGAATVEHHDPLPGEGSAGSLGHPAHCTHPCHSAGSFKHLASVYFLETGATFWKRAAAASSLPPTAIDGSFFQFQFAKARFAIRPSWNWSHFWRQTLVVYATITVSAICNLGYIYSQHTCGWCMFLKGKPQKTTSFEVHLNNAIYDGGSIATLWHCTKQNKRHVIHIVKIEKIFIHDSRVQHPDGRTDGYTTTAVTPRASLQSNANNLSRLGGSYWRPINVFLWNKEAININSWLCFR